MADRAQQILYNLIYEEILHTYAFERNKLNNEDFKDKPFEIHFKSIVNSDYFSITNHNIPNSIHNNVDKVVIVRARKDHVALFSVRTYPFIEAYSFDKEDGSLIIRTTLNKLNNYIASQNEIISKQLNKFPKTDANPTNETVITKYTIASLEDKCNENVKTICDVIIKRLYSDSIYSNKSSISFPLIYCASYDKTPNITEPAVSTIIANYDLENFLLVGISENDNIKYLPVLRNSFNNMIKSLNLKWHISLNNELIIDVNMTNFRNRLLNQITNETGTHK